MLQEKAAREDAEREAAEAQKEAKEAKRRAEEMEKEAKRQAKLAAQEKERMEQELKVFTHDNNHNYRLMIRIIINIALIHECPVSQVI